MDQTDVKIRTQRRRGCVFYGCLSVVVLIVVVLLALYIGSKIGLRKLAANYTSSTPLSLPQVVYPDSEIDALEERIFKYLKSVDQKAEASPFELTTRDLNMFLKEYQPGLMQMGDFALELAPGEVRAQMSIPLDAFGRSAFKGRFLNAEATLEMAMTNDTLVLGVKNLSAKGRPLPSFVVAQFQSKGFLGAVNDNPKIQQLAARLERIEIKEGSVLLWPKPFTK